MPECQKNKFEWKNDNTDIINKDFGNKMEHTNEKHQSDGVKHCCYGTCNSDTRYRHRESMKDVFFSTFFYIQKYLLYRVFCSNAKGFSTPREPVFIIQTSSHFQKLNRRSSEGPIVSVSDLFEGSISDRAIIEKSGFLNKINPFDLILADRGFTTEDLLIARQASLNSPSLFRKTYKMYSSRGVEN